MLNNEAPGSYGIHSIQWIGAFIMVCDPQQSIAEFGISLFLTLLVGLASVTANAEPLDSAREPILQKAVDGDISRSPIPRTILSIAEPAFREWVAKVPDNRLTDFGFRARQEADDAILMTPIPLFFP
jgi:hypothetical protein